jgi:hypothetical protein
MLLTTTGPLRSPLRQRPRHQGLRLHFGGSSDSGNVDGACMMGFGGCVPLHLSTLHVPSSSLLVLHKDTRSSLKPHLAYNDMGYCAQREDIYVRTNTYIPLSLCPDAHVTFLFVRRPESTSTTPAPSAAISTAPSPTSSSSSQAGSPRIRGRRQHALCGPCRLQLAHP